MVTLLYVEDDDHDFQLFEEMVAELVGGDYQLLRARSDTEALRLIFQESVDIVFLDNHIGCCSGVAFVDNMRKIGCRVPMVILTGDDDRVADQAAWSAGACNFLGKATLSAEVIERTVRYCCRGNDRDEETTAASISDFASFDPNGPVKKRILLIEDDEDDYLIARDMLTEAYGADLDLVWCAEAGKGRECLLCGSFDVVLIDFRLGGDSGLDLVRDAAQAGIDCPLIVLTGDNNRETDIAALQAGATDYLVKSEITSTLIDRAIRYSIERFRSEKQLAELAKFDQLTGVANRYLFHEFLDQEIAKCRLSGSRFGLLLIDLDRFKLINDTHGHDIGDKLLQEMARRIKRSVRASDLVARLGGDEFVVVLTEISDASEAHAKAYDVSEAIHLPFHVEGSHLEPGASLGVSVFPDDAGTIEELIVSADAAMYSAKRQPPLKVGLYTKEMRVSTNRRVSLERTMKFAIEASQFTLRYQPKYDAEAGQITAFEALLRWRHPELGEISPGEFVRIAEDNGAIVAIGDWVIGAACLQLFKWREAGFPDLSVAVNVSARQLCDHGFPDRIARMLDKYRLPSHALEIEVTESGIMRNPDQAYKLLGQIVDLGVRVALDDFGTGYSSLVHLRDFPGDMIKIDKSFISNVDTNPRDASIVDALISVAHRMNLVVVAEGVETARQFNFLRQRRCDYIQGYFISRPLLAEDIDQELCHDRLQIELDM